jgi:hypothetical protein
VCSDHHGFSAGIELWAASATENLQDRGGDGKKEPRKAIQKTSQKYKRDEKSQEKQSKRQVQNRIKSSSFVIFDYEFRRVF